MKKRWATTPTPSKLRYRGTLRVPIIGVVLIWTVVQPNQLYHMRFNINPRFGNVRPFVSLETTHEGAGGELKTGVTTYVTHDDGSESYRITSIGGNLRSDHAYDVIQERLGNETTDRIVSDDSVDVSYVGTIKQNELARKLKADEKEAAASTSKKTTTRGRKVAATA